MLVNCPECKKEMSDQAAACPNCGYKNLKQSSAKTPWPLALVLAIVLLIATGTAPLQSASMVALAAIACAVVAGVRREVGWVAPSVLIFIVLAVLGNRVAPGASGIEGGESAAPGSQAATSGATAEEQVAEIEDWNWGADSSFAGRGAVIWNVKVKNKGSRPLSMVRVEMVTYDKSQKMISTDHTFVTAIPPGESRSSKSYADYYGTEHTAQAQIVDVTFAR